MNSESGSNFEESSSEPNNAGIQSEEQFSSPGNEPGNLLPGGNYDFEQEVPEEGASGSYRSSQKESYQRNEFLDKDIDFASLDVNKLLQLSDDLKTMREQLFLATEELRDRKELYESGIADRNAHIEYLEFELSKVERERDDSKREKEDLEFRLNQAEKSFKSQLGESEKRIGLFENNRLGGLRAQHEEVSFKMQYQMAKVELDNVAGKLQAANERINQLETEVK